MHIFKPLTLSLMLLIIAVVWVLTYRLARRGRRYSEGRQLIERDDNFRILGKVIFLSMNLFTLASFWFDAKLLLFFSRSDWTRFAGILVLIAGTVLYRKSMAYLGDNYSPCFDAHLPFQIVTRGPYRFIRHPLYLANILQGVGYILTSGSLWVLFVAGYGILSIFRAVRKEESYLARNFSEYESYRASTTRLIPFIY